MVPGEYRLDRVSARLIERLEGARRSYVGRPDEAAAAFERIATGHVEAALGEFRGLALDDPGGRHATFLRREVLETVLPRYTRAAVDMTAREAARFGLGVLGTPVGRFVFALLAFGVTLVALRAPQIPPPVVWAVFPLLASSPFLPDLVRWLHRRQHEAELRSIVDDARAIQDREGDYLAEDVLALADAPSSASRAAAEPSRPPAAKESS